MIYARIEGRSVLRPDGRSGVVGRIDARPGRRRQQRPQLQRQRIAQAGVDALIQPIERHCARRRAANRIHKAELLRRIGADASGIEARRTIFRKIADALFNGGNDSGDRQPLPNLQRLIIAEEKGSVFANGAADAAAELILAVLLFGQGRAAREIVIAIRVELIVAQEFKERAVKIVRAGFGQDVDHAARGAADLGAV